MAGIVSIDTKEKTHQNCNQGLTLFALMKIESLAIKVIQIAKRIK